MVHKRTRGAAASGGHSRRTFPFPLSPRKLLAQMVMSERTHWFTEHRRKLEEFGRYALAWRTGREQKQIHTSNDERYEQFFVDASDLIGGLTELAEQEQASEQAVQMLSICLAALRHKIDADQQAISSAPYHVRGFYTYTLCATILTSCLRLLPIEIEVLAVACLQGLQASFKDAPPELAASLKIYQGWRDNEHKKYVRLNGEPIVYIAANVGSEGFDWGNEGPGAADLAVSILVDFLGAPVSDDLTQEFLHTVVAHWEENWILTGQQLSSWIEEHSN